MDGILNILKPPGMTSHDVVSAVRRKTGIKKAGHTGTLDPNAAGVLPVCIGKATKVSNYLMESKKKYRAELTLGLITDTQDIYGTVIEKKTAAFSHEEIADAILGFVGSYEQVPPMYSALKVEGKKLYDLARAGIEVNRESRKVMIHEINIIKVENNKAVFDAVCSKGTYIRTLCHDIGQVLNCGGIMSFLLRLETSGFKLESSITLEELYKMNEIESVLYPLDFPLQHLQRIDIHKAYKNLCLNGAKLYSKHMTEKTKLCVEKTVRIYCDEIFIGLGTVKEDEYNKLFIKFNRVFV